MTKERIEELRQDIAGNELLEFIPNNLGISLCVVEDIIINKQEDGQQLKDIAITFIPTAECSLDEQSEM